MTLIVTDLIEGDEFTFQAEVTCTNYPSILSDIGHHSADHRNQRTADLRDRGDCARMVNGAWPGARGSGSARKAAAAVEVDRPIGPHAGQGR